MKLETATFVRLRRLAPALDDVLNAGDVEHADRPWALLRLPSYAHSCLTHTTANTRATLRKHDSTPWNHSSLEDRTSFAH
jgi:hypothetical protein